MAITPAKNEAVSARYISRREIVEIALSNGNFIEISTEQLPPCVCVSGTLAAALAYVNYHAERYLHGQ